MDDHKAGLIRMISTGVGGCGALGIAAWVMGALTNAPEVPPADDARPAAAAVEYVPPPERAETPEQIRRRERAQLARSLDLRIGAAYELRTSPWLVATRPGADPEPGAPEPRQIAAGTLMHVLEVADVTGDRHLFHVAIPTLGDDGWIDAEDLVDDPPFLTVAKVAGLGSGGGPATSSAGAAAPRTQLEATLTPVRLRDGRTLLAKAVEEAGSEVRITLRTGTTVSYPRSDIADDGGSSHR